MSQNMSQKRTNISHSKRIYSLFLPLVWSPGFLTLRLYFIRLTLRTALYVGDLSKTHTTGIF